MHQQNTFSDVESALSLRYEAQPFHKSTIRGGDPSSEEEQDGKFLNEGAIGKPLASKPPTEENHPQRNDVYLKHQTISSAELKLSRTWSEEEEHVR